MKIHLNLLLVLLSFSTFAQQNFPVNGVIDQRPTSYALQHATIVVDDQITIENATLLIDMGRVVGVGVDLDIPAGVKRIDLEGKFIYPAFIDPLTSYGLKASVRKPRGEAPQYEAITEGAYGWNEAIKSYFHSASEFNVDTKAAQKLREVGFGAVLSHRADGIMTGTSVIALLGDDPTQEMLINTRAAFHLSFNKGTSNQSYPSSIMGSVALIRQSYYDADWYQREGNKIQTNLALEGVNANRNLPQFFKPEGDLQRLVLADNIGDEFGIQYVLVANGDEYQRIDLIKNTRAKLIVPLNYPDAYKVDDPLDALEISISDLKHWELAPTNPGVLEKNNIVFAFTSNGLKESKDYLKNIRRSIADGLSKSQALKAITSVPAQLIRIENELGALRSGMRANFVITSGDLFEEKTKIFETWIQGKPYKIADRDEVLLAGEYDLNVKGQQYALEIQDATKGKISINDSVSWVVTVKLEDQLVGLSYKDSSGALIALSGWVEENHLRGTGRSDSGQWISWEAKRTNDLKPKPEKSPAESTPDPKGALIYPFVAFGNEQIPTQEDVVFKNATVWTMEDQGVLEGTDVLVRNGKIAQIAKNISSSGVREIDATGMHLTPGIIDEHSHAALSGVNEGSYAIVSEVRMKDAVDAKDSDIYRQLSGGVTMVQLLHGSANPVGGQSAIVKFKWGHTADEMLVGGADSYIKFALGENVKQSNRSNSWSTRFPQTRMGVEQVYIEGFNRALNYDKEWAKYQSLSPKLKQKSVIPRRDLQLEALAEIINKQRFITCHSYVQSEINMIMKVAEKYDFNINTFTHILEGYKVADKMAEHGAGASTFSDWWSYKYEVKDAIPYNASLMAQAGVLVAINSDDAEMARRLNQEAAKSVRYGNMEAYDALKMVTINPAKMLHLDQRTGSLKVGKDADIVLWTDHPLSIYAKVSKTMVEGTVYFDQDQDIALRDAMQKERTRIINKMIAVKKAGGKTSTYTPQEKHRWDCEEFVDVEILND